MKRLLKIAFIISLTSITIGFPARKNFPAKVVAIKTSLPLLQQGRIRLSLYQRIVYCWTAANPAILMEK
jgi:hypothetical protein